jgi:lysophospholipase L1-like esterase
MRIILAVVLLISGTVAQTSYDSLYRKSTVYKNLTAHFELSRIQRAEIVFLGNSITFGGNWTELLGRHNVVNRGIGGDNLPGMLNRLHQVLRLQPKICFVMAGINDLYTDAPVDEVFRRYTQLLDTLRAHSITPVIQSTLHVNPKWKRTEEKNPQVRMLNAMLQQYAVDHSVTFIDLNALLSADGVLKDEYTTDGVHLTPAAYEVWRDRLESVLNNHGM